MINYINSTGDPRANQSPQLAVLQIVQFREHNRIAKKLEELNPQWTDETLYQEARRINTAIHQHISYYEWLPIILGKENMLANGLIYENDGDYINDYDPSVNPATYNEHSAAAFRYFHTAIAGFLRFE